MIWLLRCAFVSSIGEVTGKVECGALGDLVHGMVVYRGIDCPLESHSREDEELIGSEIRLHFDHDR